MRQDEIAQIESTLNYAHNIEQVFKYQVPNEEAKDRHDAIRDAARKFAEAILLNTAPCADQSVALLKVREAMFYGNAAISLKGLI